MKRHRSLIFQLLVFCSLFFVMPATAENITTDLEDNRLDIGRVDEGKSAEKSFLVINNSDAAVKISVEALGCSCFKVISPKGKAELAPGDQQKIIFKFDSTGFSSSVSKPLYIYTTDKVNSVIRVEVSADVIAKKGTFINRFLSFNSLAIIGAGLADGVNPCAFTVMVFFVSFLSFAGYSRRQMLMVGSVFILATYLAYLLIGIGALKAIRSLVEVGYLSRLFYRAIAGFSFIVGILNLYDFRVYQKTKDADKIVIKLPFLVKRKIQEVVRRDFIGKSDKAFFALMAASFSCGILVSFLELFCTGQLYLPTIAYILRVENLRLGAIFYLLLYNLMFIMPLVAVFILAFYGATSKSFEKIARRNLAAVKLASAIIFFGLGAVLLIIKG